MATLAKAETAANLPVLFMNSRRVVEASMEDVMAVLSPIGMAAFSIARKKHRNLASHSSADSPVVKMNLIPPRIAVERLNRSR